MRLGFVNKISIWLILNATLWAPFGVTQSVAQTPAEVRQAFIDLHDDRVPHNCEHATDWLLKYREELKDDLVDEVYKTDWQGQDSILEILCGMESFVPDRRFIHLLATTLRDDEVLYNCQRATKWLYERRETLKDDLQEELYKTDWQGRNAILGILDETKSFVPDERFMQFVVDTIDERSRRSDFKRTMDADCKFISDHFSDFDSHLKTQISHTTSRPNDVLKLWAITWLAKKRGVLDEYMRLITPAVFAAAAENLKDDQVEHNASEAVRFFLLLGDRSLPILEQTAKSRDKQAANLAKATMAALRGERSAFGFLVTRIDVSESAFGPPVDDPDWIKKAAEPYFRREEYP